MVRRFPLDNMELSEVGFGSGILTDGTTSGPGEECGLARDGPGGDASDSRGLSCNSGEGGSSELLTRGRNDLIATYLIVVEQWCRCDQGQLNPIPSSVKCLREEPY